MTAPKQPIQSGESVHLLCGSCEALFSGWENSFRKGFYPVGGLASLPLDYGPWLFPFAVSIAWRVLMYLKLSRPNPYEYHPDGIASYMVQSLPDDIDDDAEAALRAWSTSLLHAGSVPRRFAPKLMFLSGRNFVGETVNLVGFTALSDENTSILVAGLGAVLVLAPLRRPPVGVWRGCDIDPSGGTFSAVSQNIPASIGDMLRRFYATAGRVNAEMD